MDENLDPKLADFFSEASCDARWRRLLEIHETDHSSFRVLFLVEAMALVDNWREPTVDELNRLLHHVMKGGRIAVRTGRIVDLFQPVWPLEVAKYEYLVHRATWDSDFRRRYFLTSIRSFATALVQAWWCLETIMNDLAGIIAKQRRATLDHTTLALLEEKRSAVDRTGAVVFEPYYQPVLSRLQLIFRTLTGKQLERGSADWNHLVALKDARDAYVHRVGKDSSKNNDPFTDDAVLSNGFSAVRRTLALLLTETPELAERFIYRFLAFWSCGNDSPFIWDGTEGDGFYLGVGRVSKDAVVGLFAPQPRSFSAGMTEDFNGELSAR